MNDIKPIKFCGVDSKRPVVIAGPCSAETEEQETAHQTGRIRRCGQCRSDMVAGGEEGDWYACGNRGCKQTAC